MYQKKLVVAPMVRISTLPYRLLCLDYGADYVYSEEIIDFKMLRCVKEVNDNLGTIDFVDKTDGTVFFRTTPREKRNLIFQIGTSDAQRALKVAKMVEPYVFGIDINMGCPKEFSIKGGMGAALLKQPEKIKQILTTLVQNVKVNVSCKIRILENFEETLQLCKMIESCGVAHMAVHGRTREERPNHDNHNDVIRKIASELLIPVFANGGSREMQCYEDIELFRQDTQTSSVMIARAAMWNCSILRKDGLLPVQEVIRSYLKYCVRFDNAFVMTKYTIQNMLRDVQSTPMGKAFLETQTLLEICKLWNLEDEYREQTGARLDQEKKLNIVSRSFTPLSIEEIPIDKTLDASGTEIIKMPLRFIRGNYSSAQMPKMLVNTIAFEKKYNKPLYTSHTVDRSFTATLEIADKKFSSTIREKNRRYAEQGAALVFLHSEGFVEKTYGLIALEGTRKHTNNKRLEEDESTKVQPPHKLARVEVL